MSEAKESLFAPRRAGETSMFGYEGKCCDLAMNSGRVDMVKECIGRGWMDKTTRNLPGESMVVMAERRGKNAVAKYLRSIGWQ